MVVVVGAEWDVWMELEVEWRAWGRSLVVGFADFDIVKLSEGMGWMNIELNISLKDS